MVPEVFVADTNVLFPFFRKDSATASVITGRHGGAIKLLAPELAKAELNKYKLLLCSKSGILPELFDRLLSLLEYFVEFIPLDEYKKHMPKAISLANAFSSKDKEDFMNDVDFFALALKEKCSIWSKDKLFKKQSRIKVLNTPELLTELGLK